VKKKPQQDFEMLPEYDFSKGVRGKYAGRYAAARDTDVAQRWKEEVMVRVEEVRRGKVVLIPGAEALAQLRRRFSRD
jgi:hypothetical protein